MNTREISVGFKVNAEEKALLDAAANREDGGNLAEFCRSTALAMAQATESSGEDFKEIERLAERLYQRVKSARLTYDVEFADLLRTKAKLDEARERQPIEL